MSPVSRELLSINTIRTLSMDGVQKANSGHPGTPMALAPVTYAVWNQALRYDPADPLWPARDRFVLSCGHASMLLYSTLHLAGVRKVEFSGPGVGSGQVLDQPAIRVEDLQNFRQLHSPCAGHPEYGESAGIETTTGPLGQGIGNSVGMAMAAQWFAARYNRPGFELFGYDVYTLCSDGDVMEGIGCEAASIAGHLQLGNLCWIYDDNKITIEGETELAFSEDVAKRFEGMGWRTVVVEDANDLGQIQHALNTFRETPDKPTLVVLKSIIGFGSPNKANSHAAHGAPLGDDEVKLTKRAYGWPEDQKFLVPDEAKADFAQGLGARGARLRAEWHAKFQEYSQAYPELAAELRRIWAGELPEGWEASLPVFPADPKGLATRVSSGKVLNAVAPKFPWLIGGSADLAPSTMTMLDHADAGHFGHANYGGRNLHFGIREHAMGAICNGLALSGLRPYGATFFVFSDYVRPSVRLSSLMRLPVLYIFTHDSIGLGEDGPTHQPVEHLAACRAIPGLMVLRPADANEVSEAYRVILSNRRRPAALVLSRQNVPTLDRTQFGPAAGTARGAYILADAADGKPEVIVIGTGSEIALCLTAHQQLTAAGVKARLVSMPSWELFDEQDQAYRDSVLPPSVTARVAVEAGLRMGWDKYIGLKGRFVGMSSFGASAPAGTLYKHFGITPERIVEEAREAVKG
ncbi:MAG: transketolase [Pirellulales bacterium]